MFSPAATRREVPLSLATSLSPAVPGLISAWHLERRAAPRRLHPAAFCCYFSHLRHNFFFFFPPPIKRPLCPMERKSRSSVVMLALGMLLVRPAGSCPCSSLCPSVTQWGWLFVSGTFQSPPGRRSRTPAHPLSSTLCLSTCSTLLLSRKTLSQFDLKTSRARARTNYLAARCSG